MSYYALKGIVKKKFNDQKQLSSHVRQNYWTRMKQLMTRFMFFTPPQDLGFEDTLETAPVSIINKDIFTGTTKLRWRA